MFKQSEQNISVNGARRFVWRRGLASACAWLGILGATTTARGQCMEGHFIAPNGAAGDSLGYALAISGDTAIVSALLDDTTGGIDAGSAFIFVRSGGVWTQQAHLFASDGAVGDQFGYSVAIDGDTAVVGADWDNTAAGTNAGSAYVFVRHGGAWTQQAKLLASDAAANDILGVSIAISGDTVVVGAPGDNTPVGNDAGSAYVFVRNGTVWTQQAHLFASDAAAGDFFSGYSIDLDGDTLVVGAFADDTPDGTDAGSAYVFVRNGVVWTEQAHLFASDGAANDSFGNTVSISGDTILVGATGIYPPDGITNAGSAYVFVREIGVWTEQQILVSPNPSGIEHFGWSVAVDGQAALVGAPGDPQLGGGPDIGTAYTFVRNGNVWTVNSQLNPSDGAPGDIFGFSVALSAETAVVGADFDDTSVAVDAGTTYAFNLGCTPGDMNCDNVVNFADVDGFALALVDPAAYLAAYPTCSAARADVNQDLLINGRDTQAFVAALLGP